MVEAVTRTMAATMRRALAAAVQQGVGNAVAPMAAGSSMRAPSVGMRMFRSNVRASSLMASGGSRSAVRAFTSTSAPETPGEVAPIEDEEKPSGPLELDQLTVIGGGNMAEAILTGLLADNLVSSDKIVVSDPNPDIRAKYKVKNIRTSDRNSLAVKDADVILVAVKPQVLNDVLESLQGAMKPDTLVLSVVAGASLKGMQEILGPHTRIVRSMPNTPAMIGEGTTVWAQSAEVTEEQHTLTRGILGAFGIEVFVDDENALDMATALSGSGPAYFFLVAEAMIDTAVHMGFSRPVATKLVQQTMLGSALYMQSSDAHPVLLRNNITSPGGTTAAALYRAEKNGFRAVIADSIWAAYERCLELGSPVPVVRKRPRS